jgi:hypothetical protein
MRHRDRANARPVDRRDSGTRSRLEFAYRSIAARAHDAQGANVLVACEHVVVDEPEAFRAKTIEPDQQCAATTEFWGDTGDALQGLRDDFACRIEMRGLRDTRWDREPPHADQPHHNRRPGN